MPASEEADWLSVGEATEAILSDTKPLGVERQPLKRALGYALAERVVSPVDLPPWDNSAMDGFAVISRDILGAARGNPCVLEVVDDIPAGAFPKRRVEPGQASRIMTGAPVPEGTDTVVRIEHTDGGTSIGDAGASVTVYEEGDAKRNIRGRGEDLRRGDVVLETGVRLGPAEIGVAASVGRPDLEVYRMPKVALLTSGDELVDLDGFDEVLAGRRIISSNTYTLAAQLAGIGIQTRVLGIAADTPQSVREHIERARGCDVLVTSAGVSVGEHDYLKAVLREMRTETHFWRVRMRPGSAFAYGRVGALDDMQWFGLPGNPVSSMVTFDLLVRPALLRLAGHQRIFRPTRRVRLAEELPGKTGLARFVRARLREGASDETAAVLTGAQGSGLLTSMTAADALLYIPEGRGSVHAGEMLTAIILGGEPSQRDPGF